MKNRMFLWFICFVSLTSSFFVSAMQKEQSHEIQPGGQKDFLFAKIQLVNDRLSQLTEKHENVCAENKKLRLSIQPGCVQISEKLFTDTLQAVKTSNQEIAQLTNEKLLLNNQIIRLIVELDHQQTIFVFTNQILRDSLQKKDKTLSAISHCLTSVLGKTSISSMKIIVNEKDILKTTESFYEKMLHDWKNFGISAEKGKDVPMRFVSCLSYTDHNDKEYDWRHRMPFFIQDVVLAQVSANNLSSGEVVKNFNNFLFPRWIPAEVVDGKHYLTLFVMGVPIECEIITIQERPLVDVYNTIQDEAVSAIKVETIEQKQSFVRPVLITIVGTSCLWVAGLLAYKCNADPSFFTAIMEQLQGILFNRQ